MPQTDARIAYEALVHRKEHEKYRYYEPIGKVEKFIDLFGSGNYFIVLLSAANGVGKTFAGANILAHLMWPAGNQYFQSPLFKNWPFPKRGRIVSDPTTVTKTLIPTLKDQFPAGRFGLEKYSTTKEGKQYESQWKTDTGWEFDVMTYEQETKEFESATLGFAWFDEPPPEAIFKATVARMRQGGIIFITATPLMGSAWMYDSIITNPHNEEGKRAFIEAEVEDACKLHGVRGFLEHQNILNMVAQYSEEDKQARVYGKFQHLTGLVFKEWRHDIHVIRPFTITLRDFCVFERLDPHPRNPDAVIWVAMDRKGTKFVCDEIYTRAITDELALKIKSKANQYRIIDRKADPAAFVEDEHYKESLARNLAKLGLAYQEASKERAQATRRIHDALAYQFVGNELYKAPELYVFDTCYRTIYEFEHWQYNEYTGKSAEKHDPSEKPQDRDDHMMENLGRVLIDEPFFVEMPRGYGQSLPRGTETVNPASLDPYAKSRNNVASETISQESVDPFAR